MPGKLPENLRSQLVERILSELEVNPSLRSAGYLQSEGKNYGSYSRADALVIREEDGEIIVESRATQAGGS